MPVSPLILVALGGAAGAVARFALGSWVQGWAGAAFPWGTLLVNLLGSTLLGVFLRMWELLAWSHQLRALVAVGVLGGFTTFSTFSYEAVAMLQAGQWGRALLYLAASVLLGLLGVWMGLSAGASLARLAS